MGSRKKSGAGVGRKRAMPTVEEAARWDLPPMMQMGAAVAPLALKFVTDFLGLLERGVTALEEYNALRWAEHEHGTRGLDGVPRPGAGEDVLFGARERLTEIHERRKKEGSGS